MQTREKKLAYLRKTIETLWHGVSDTKEGDYPKIVYLYKEILKLDYKDRDAWENMIWLMWSLSVNQKDYSWISHAEIYAKRYLALNPNGYRSYEFLGTFYRTMLIDYKLSLRLFESAIRWKDSQLTTHHSLINLCLKNDDKIRAIGYCKLTLTKFPNDPYTKNKLEVLTKL